MKDRKRVIERIAKLFQYNRDGTGGTEAEILLAVTRAKEMMMRHAISDAEVQAALNAAAKTGRTPSFDIRSYTAFTRKIRRLAHYDELVATAVMHLTTTHAILREIYDRENKKYISIQFVGDVADTELASALFMILLKTVRRRARENYGHGKNEWTKKHTSYAVGFATRLCERAQDMSGTLSTKEQQSYALVVRGKKEAIAAFIGELTPPDKRRTNYDAKAMFSGWLDGGEEVLDKRGIT